MKVIVREREKTKLHLTLPTGLVMNGFSAQIAPLVIRKSGYDCSAEQVRALFRAIRQYKRAHPDWRLVDIQTKDGDTIIVEL